ncbi:PREDICTED: ABC transporter G family member 11-like isoform X3 [Ipomoea nil]|uniref:ABC transporter G family member 11-like isoform X3 n=1 Tax=Ipomoea nil TaxID=35883 RepID=UPI0009016CAC|nr:PREDICTED: ABC transporter G family member 11-like isoform X3 [Ipomoea nil]
MEAGRGLFGSGGGDFRSPEEPFLTPANGVFLTWEDLWVTVSAKEGTKAILKGLTGYARPGELLALMGPSGSGKSTLLDALAGRLELTTRQSGDILINGRKQTLAYGTSAYVTQDDNLISSLTVREAVYFSAQLQLPNSVARWEKKEIAEMTIKEMGLQGAMDTRIGGGWGSKGISGGQKRRVSICLEILTRPKLLFLDEPSSGLDSAASFYVMSKIMDLASEGRTVVASIHQPSAEVFSLFTNLCLLSSGSLVYFGPASAAIQFFETCGFPCPPLQNPSDHFLKTINKDFDGYDEESLRGRARSMPTEEIINILVRSYRSSDRYQEVQTQVAEICRQEGEMLKKSSHASFMTQSVVLTKRSFLNMYRDLGYYWLRLAIYIIMGVGLGLMYKDIGRSYTSIQARCSVIMFVASFLTFMAIGGFPSFVEDMKVFQREKLNGHYGCGAFVIGNSFSSVPYLLLISLIPGLLAYYPIGLQRGFQHFVYFALVLFTSMLLVESLMMIVASLVPSYLMGIISGAGLQAVMILGGGYFRLPGDMPGPFWKYPVYYVSYNRYVYHGLFKNEFVGLWFEGMREGEVITGDEVLRDLLQVEMRYSKWVDLLVLLGMVVLYRVLFFLIVKGTDEAKPAIKSLMMRATPNQLSLQTPTYVV